MSQLIQSIKILSNITKNDIARLEKKHSISTVKLHKVEQSIISAVDTTPWTLTSEGIVVKEEVDGVPMALAI
jgi:hypothetical protein|tara:strand:- start:205 stop:420 length:216 start_codon:yes stop_codon:yes gene_type:complete